MQGPLPPCTLDPELALNILLPEAHGAQMKCTQMKMYVILKATVLVPETVLVPLLGVKTPVTINQATTYCTALTWHGTPQPTHTS